MRRIAMLLLALAGLAVACYETPQPDCAFLCGPDTGCPEGYSCGEDGWCKRDTAPDSVECGPPVVDASAPADAGPDADPG